MLDLSQHIVNLSEGWAKAGAFGVLLDVQLFKSITY
ncbi:hypothetical protein V6Z12_D02G227800 [Gossypium hirsutum]